MDRIQKRILFQKVVYHRQSPREMKTTPVTSRERYLLFGLYCGLDLCRKLLLIPHTQSGFGGLEVACWPLVPKFAVSHPA
jgi:hypothetical protein